MQYNFNTISIQIWAHIGAHIAAHTKFRDLGGIEADQPENLAPSVVFYAEQEYTHKKQQWTQFHLQISKMFHLQKNRTQPKKNDTYLLALRKGEEG